MMLSNRTASPKGGRGSARRLLAAALSVCVLVPGAQAVTAERPSAPRVSVREQGGVYSVTARFEVPQPRPVVLRVLSDYEQIPRFLPEVRRSVVLERSPGRLLVEQEAVSRFMMFSKKVHLLLEVTETADALRFADRCGTSFTTYEGVWRVVPHNGGATVTYELTARPGFDVPEFILKRLLRRDAGQMIDRLREEFRARAAAAGR